MPSHAHVTAAVALLLAACGDDPTSGHNENEVITTVTLTFVPDDGDAALVFAFVDPDGDGGEAPVVDPIALPAGDYALTVALANALETPAEDITEEVRDEAEDHQLFFTGTAIDGPASDRPGAPLAHAYDDGDGDGLPVGLVNAIAASAGEGVLTVTLRHLPPLDGAASKVAGLAEQVADQGLAGLPGATDAQVDFDVTVP